MKNLRPEYKESSKVKFRLCGRGRYPTKSYSKYIFRISNTEVFTEHGSKNNIGGDGAYYQY